jgi:MSHA biogenesis protein MshN
MLQDLETRQSDGPVVSADYHAPEKNTRRNWLWLITSIFLLLVLYLWFAQPLWLSKSLDSLGITGNQNSPPLVVARSTSETQTPRENTPKRMLSPKTMQAEKIPPTSPSEVAQVATQSLDESIIQEHTSSPTETHRTENNNLSTQQTQDTKTTKVAVFEDHSASKSKGQEKVQTDVPVEDRQVKASFSMNDSSQKSKNAGLRQRVMDALNKGDNAQAINLLQRLLGQEPENIPATKKLAALLFAQGENQQAANILRDALTKYPLRSDFRLMLARLYVQQDKHHEAFSLLGGFSPSAGKQLEYLSYRAALAQQLDENELAQSDYNLLTQAEPKNAKWWLGMAIAKDKLGRSAEALNAYRKANNKEQLSPSVIEFVRQRMQEISGV